MGGAIHIISFVLSMIIDAVSPVQEARDMQNNLSEKFNVKLMVDSADSLEKNIDRVLKYIQ